MSDTTDLMEETGSTYQIVLADGSVISGLRKNGDCFISDAEIDSSGTISTGEEEDEDEGSDDSD